VYADRRGATTSEAKGRQNHKTIEPVENSRRFAMVADRLANAGLHRREGGAMNCLAALDRTESRQRR